MRTTWAVVTALSLLSIAESRGGGEGTLGYSRADVGSFSSSRSKGYGSSRRYNSSRVFDTVKIKRVERRNGVPDFLKNLVQGVSGGLEQIGFKPDVATIRENLMAYSKKIVGKAVTQVDYEAKQIGSVFKDQAGKIADGYVGLVKQQAMREDAVLNKIENDYGKLTIKNLRSKVLPEIDQTLKQIPDKNLENIARSLMGSIDVAIDQQIPKELKTIPVSGFRKQLKVLQARQHSQQKKMVDGLKSNIDEVVDRKIARPLDQALSVAITPVAKQWMRKCNAIAVIEKKACIAKLTRATAALKDLQIKSITEAVRWYLLQYERVIEAAKPSISMMKSPWSVWKNGGPSRFE